MWSIIFKITKQILCILFIGIVIKLMDDYIDQDIDKLAGQYNLFNLTHIRIMPYILLIFAIACSFDLNTSITLFFASYSLGMMQSIDTKMFTSLYSYQESILVIILGIFLFGFHDMLSSLFIIAFIHLIDDYLDCDKDKNYKKNWVFILGKVEVIVLSIIFLLSALYLNIYKSVLVIIVAHPVVYITHLLYNKLLNKRNDCHV